MSSKYYTTREKADQFDSVISVFTALLREVKELGKKKPDATLSKSKVALLNRVLIDARQVLAGEAESKYLELLEEDDLPQYSDAILVMSQFEGALTAFRDRHYGYSNGETQWFVK